MLRFITGYSNYLGLNRVVIDFQIDNLVLRECMNNIKKDFQTLTIIFIIRLNGDDGDCDAMWEKYIEFQKCFKEENIDI